MTRKRSWRKETVAKHRKHARLTRNVSTRLSVVQHEALVAFAIEDKLGFSAMLRKTVEWYMQFRDRRAAG